MDAPASTFESEVYPTILRDSHVEAFSPRVTLPVVEPPVEQKFSLTPEAPSYTP